ncbi:AAA family ATPase [Thalassotalea piscium]|uniref:Type II secretory pathway predicted ATPase ExeA n=1 Tax=Thalassotalea piscium TaxID=1230533 RepID=A0A7X0TTD4_9GAMM|nr:AAA family ATPase [Thalassotalea piscium]MBB6543028.1 type II secretory pathway predicted ATPase ExeA [Thalassotalea piscium]
MYTRYFDLKEAPFTIAPNPAYLFMSDRHREALAHLTYGLGDTGGFVLLTGEVGTGKTTICRSVMEQLSDNTQAVFILNPTLSCLELLATICDGLKIRYKKTGATLNYFTDKILAKLTKNHDNNINTLLVIDEAQHLQAEVLEQLRLLTNLETNTKKLLQVILIGQPELQQLLQRRDLRQLAQRITARYHLLPLTKAQLKQYIQHRLSVAQCTRSLFTDGAIASIHQISKGIPRVVNLLCERSLIIAYSTNNTQVSRGIVKKAAIEALGEEGKTTSVFWSMPMKLSYLTLIVGATLFIGYWLGNGAIGNAELTSQAPVASQPAQTSQIASELMQTNNDTLAIPEDLIISKKVQKESENSAEALNKLPEVKESQLDKQTEHNSKQVSEDALVDVSAPEDSISATFKVTATPEVSDEVLARFQSALEATANEPIENTNHITPASEIKPLSQMPLWLQEAIPALKFEMHLFSSDGLGWVRVNGEDKYQGDTIAEGLVLTDILPQQVILTYQGEQFSMAALSSW